MLLHRVPNIPIAPCQKNARNHSVKNIIEWYPFRVRISNPIPPFFLFVRTHPVLTSILGGALILRVLGVTYGLPLMLIDDEPPFTLAALLMLQTHTLIPSLNPELFQTVLYYPPYLSYLYLIPFAGYLAVSFFSFSGDMSAFVSALTYDLSPFFLIARSFSVIFGVLSIYLVYKISLSLFSSSRAALLSAFLMATSVSHLALSMVARHWVPATLVGIGVLYLLTEKSLSSFRRYGYALLLAGVGTGISSISVVFVFLIALHFLLFREMRIVDALRSRFMWACGVLSLGCAILPSILFSKSTGFVVDLTLSQPKSFLGVLGSSAQALSVHALSEPVLVGTFLLGLGILAVKNLRWATFTLFSVVIYAAIFYFLFRFETRFFLILVPLYALVGGYACSYLSTKRVGAFIVFLLLLIPLGASIETSFLSLKNDTRSQAATWVLEHVSPSDKVFVYGNLLRIRTNASGVAELESIDASALRKIDQAEKVLDLPFPHVLNAYTISNRSFFETLPSYLREHGYRYVVLTPDTVLENSLLEEGLSPIMKEGEIVAQFDGMGSRFSIGNSSFLDPVTLLFSGKSFGPNVVIYRVNL
jgi:hypothetical protein